MAAMAAASLKFLRCELFHARGAVFFFWGALKEDDVFRAGPYAAGVCSWNCVNGLNDFTSRLPL
jgi:hypothetical protein